MKYLFAVYFLVTVTLVDSKKKKDKDSDSDSSSEESGPTDFLMDGEIRRKFAFIATTADPSKSVICSPISAILPLGKLALGATGKTEGELNSAIGVNDRKELKKEFKSLLSKLKKLKGIHLDIASQVYIAKGFELKSTYEKNVSKLFNTKVDRIDVKDKQIAANKINAWVNHQTHGKIKTLLSPGDISPSTTMILVNAIYFSGKWKYPFKKPTPGTFHSPHGPITMPMMTIKEKFLYGKSETLGAQVIKIPYQKEQAFFYILLPNSNNGLPALLDQLKLAPELINDATLFETEVILTMPKFKIETELDLGLLYKKVGLGSMFDARSSGLDEIVKGRTLTVDKAIQKAMIEVTEEGTEAAAASAIIWAAYPMPPPPPIPKFNADHPFLYVVMSKQEQLFSGTFCGS